ncbi:AraC family transcriptional regulator [Undibacterium sp. TS12]|uniref:helix-turn-helix domain-containing protein n=1 Tax=Undibacterium sp. TS12 TaxID=2908202 RepID=UPI001F4C80EF|nr:AraC family transcriptional regulator [Undibacterium sp. TS12]MCH8622717.1 AraC family transcriptional regulator [Undibacterium sp. TS12]
MQADLRWATLELLPSAPYSVNSTSDLPTLGLAFARQRGVHAIASDRRQDFDAWPGEMAYTAAGVPLFSESGHGGEYLLLKIKEPQVIPGKTMAGPRHILHGDKTAVKLAAELRSLILCKADTLLMEERAMAWLLHGLSSLKKARSKPGRYQLERRVHASILDYMDANLTTPISLEELANLADMSLLHFLRSFSNATGMTPHAWLTERRLQHARQSLQYDKLPVAAIAIDSGFSHQSHLGATLKQKLGMSPQQYRKLYKSR